MFRCLVSIFGNRTSMQKLSGHIGGTEHCRLMMLQSVAKEIDLTSQQVTVQMQDLPEQLSLQCRQGLVALRPSKVPEQWQAEIKAEHANVLVEMPTTYALELEGALDKGLGAMKMARRG